MPEYLCEQTKKALIYALNKKEAETKFNELICKEYEEKIKITNVSNEVK